MAPVHRDEHRTEAIECLAGNVGRHTCFPGRLPVLAIYPSLVIPATPEPMSFPVWASSSRHSLRHVRASVPLAA